MMKMHLSYFCIMSGASAQMGGGASAQMGVDDMGVNMDERFMYNRNGDAVDYPPPPISPLPQFMFTPESERMHAVDAFASALREYAELTATFNNELDQRRASLRRMFEHAAFIVPAPKVHEMNMFMAQTMQVQNAKSISNSATIDSNNQQTSTAIQATIDSNNRNSGNTANTAVNAVNSGNTASGNTVNSDNKQVAVNSGNKVNAVSKQVAVNSGNKVNKQVAVNSGNKAVRSGNKAVENVSDNA
jgi:hypothetical protein